MTLGGRERGGWRSKVEGRRARCELELELDVFAPPSSLFFFSSGSVSIGQI